MSRQIGIAINKRNTLTVLFWFFFVLLRRGNWRNQKSDEDEWETLCTNIHIVRTRWVCMDGHGGAPPPGGGGGEVGSGENTFSNNLILSVSRRNFSPNDSPRVKKGIL